MNDMTMEEIAHKVIRHDEKLSHHMDEISEIKDVVKSLLETSKNQSHAIDKLMERHEDEKLGERVKDLEAAMIQARFAWKVAYGILTTPVLGYIGFKLFELLQSIPK